MYQKCSPCSSPASLKGTIYEDADKSVSSVLEKQSVKEADTDSKNHATGEYHEYFISMINNVFKGEISQEPSRKSDVMQSIWAESNCFQVKKQDLPIPLSELQSDLISKFVFNEHSSSSCHILDSESKTIFVSEEDYCFFRTPSLNQEMKDYILMQSKDKTRNSAFKARL